VAQQARQSRPDLDWADYNNHWAGAKQNFERIKAPRAAWMPGLEPVEEKQQQKNFGILQIFYASQTFLLQHPLAILSDCHRSMM
jgi:hypothetical protein